MKRANLPGYLGNCHSSGTVILDQLGEEHMKTGKPIFYTSADSVFQIAVTKRPLASTSCMSCAKSRVKS
ncbi:phosphopentomutase [Klebsiella aerogenes]|nr:phosphopentomutase [Klebsiella aerogenes]